MSESPKLERIRVEKLDENLGRKYPVLDDGFVRLIDYMGSDEAIVQAARVSYGAGTKQVHEDRGLIRYLMRHRHTTPFEMCELKLHVRIPMDHWRQYIRHRTANVNEYSTRYSEAIDATAKTDPAAWRVQSKGNRQGSTGYLDIDTGKLLSDAEANFHDDARRLYEFRLEKGVAREQARKDLPLSTYTEAYWKIDLHNLFHFLSLRMDAHAQEEIRAYADVIGTEIVDKWCPAAWNAFVDYRLKAMALSRLDIEMISAIQSGSSATVVGKGIAWGWLDDNAKPSKKSRERDEFEQKAGRLDIKVPWR